MSGHAAVRALLDGTNDEIEQEPNWDVLRGEGLVGLVACHHLWAGRALPDSIRETLLQAIAFQMRCAAVLAEVSLAAQERGIRTLTFKGCALAYGLYPRAGQRIFGDIDVAVPAGDWSGMAEVLTRLGYSQSLCNFSRGSVVIDLHLHPLHQLTQLIGPRSQEWWDHTQPLSKHTGVALRLAHEYEFVLSLFHGAKHSFSKARWVVDLALLAYKVDPRRLVEAVRRFRARRQLAYAAELLDQWFGVTLPGPLSSIAPRRWSFMERHFVGLVLQRKAPDFLGMLTPITSAPNPWSALQYLVHTLYPRDTPFGTRSQQLFAMARAALKS